MADNDALYLVIRGARGSVPTPEATNRRHGGNTCCAEIELAGDHRLLIDCGTGIRMVATGGRGDRGATRTSTSTSTGARTNTGTGAARFDVLMTHYHFDHINGLPFFPPLFDAGQRFVFHGPRFDRETVRELLEGIIRPPWFPLALADSPSEKAYREIEPGELRFGPLRVRHTPLNHPQGALAYRIDGPRSSIVFASDSERGDPRADAALAGLAAGADVLIHDAQYTPEEYERRRGWGHSTWRHACEAASEAGARRLVLFHHDPDRDDAALDRIVRKARDAFGSVEAAREGLRFEL